MTGPRSGACRVVAAMLALAATFALVASAFAQVFETEVVLFPGNSIVVTDDSGNVRTWTGFQDPSVPPLKVPIANGYRVEVKEGSPDIVTKAGGSVTMTVSPAKGSTVIMGDVAFGQNDVTVNIELVKGTIDTATVLALTEAARPGRTGRLNILSGTTRTTATAAGNEEYVSFDVTADGDGSVTTTRQDSQGGRLMLDGREIPAGTKLTRTPRGDYLDGSSKHSPSSEHVTPNGGDGKKPDGSKNGSETGTENRSSPQDEKQRKKEEDKNDVGHGGHD